MAMDTQELYQKLWEHMCADEKVARSIGVELTRIDEQTKGLMSMRKFIAGAAVTVGIAVFGSYGAFQYASGQQKTQVDTNKSAVETAQREIGEVKKDVAKIKEDTARIDERTKLILDEIRRRNP